MAEEAKTLHQQEFIERLLNPEYKDSIYGTIESGQLHILLYESAKSPPREHTLNGITPFMTLNDIKIAIYVAMDKKEIALPSHTFIGIPSVINKRFNPFEYGWSDPLEHTKSLVLMNPFELIKGNKPDTRFIEASGARRIMRIQNRDRMTFESSFLRGKRGIPTLHVFFYSVLEATIPGERPIGEHSWNGYLYPYFPNLSVESHSPNPKELELKAQGFIRKRQFYEKLDHIMKSEALFPLTLTGIRFLRINYIKPAEISGIESIFYNAPVNDLRPYMRLLPAEGTPISKLHMIGDKPNIEDPRLLQQWGQERLITPERDSAFVKILLRKQSGSISPLYCTLRLLDDGTADITIEPPKGVRKLDPRSELDGLAKTIQSALDGFPYLNITPSLSNGMFIFGLNLKGVATPFTSTSLREKLPIFSSIFQEIPPISGETPLLMLRYKLISNFTNEDRIQSFITQVLSKKLLYGDTNYGDIVELVAEDFDIDIDLARKYVANRLKDANDVRPTLLTDGDAYSIQSNPGIDIGIFAQHPFYSFHIHRVESSETLERIITFLSILFTTSSKVLSVPKASVKELIKSEVKELVEDEVEFENVPDEEEAEFENIPDEEEQTAAPRDQSELFEDLMFETSDQPTLEEEFAGNTGVAARPEPPLETHEEVEEEEEPERTLMQKINEDAVAAATTAKLVEPAKKAVAEPLSGKGFEKYFSDKLKDADRKLFDFHKTHPSLSKYVTQCQSNLMRQPAVLTEEQYQEMIKEYNDVIKSKTVAFFIFPLSKDAKKEPYNPATKEYYTIMKYGTSERVQNYYLCCKYFCIRDNIMVREVELRGTVLRRPVKLADGTFRKTKRGEDKATGFLGTCPFCEGEVIQNRRFPGVNETVIERNIKAGTVNSRHLYIRFLKKTNHPDGFYLPCCFLEDQPVRVGDPGFPADTTQRAQPVDMNLESESEDEEEGTSSSTTTVPTKKLINYEEVMFAAASAYIVGSEKLPLEGIIKRYKKIKQGVTEYVREAPKLSDPQIGLLPPQLNPYFSQDSVELVSRTFNPQKLKAGAQGFLRIGVENSAKGANDSFLSAVAPFFGRSSSSSMKKLLTDIIQPNIFVSLNYGNLLLEMYDSKAKRPAVDDKLKLWARDMLNIRKITTYNEELVIRAYMSYENFFEWLHSENTRKDPRHFANLFLQPGILETGLGRIAETGVPLEAGRRPGIIFIVIDMLKSGEIKIRCPPYPMNSELYTKSDIGFLFHHYSGVWEPIFYADNRSPAERKDKSYSLVFSNSHREKWPPIVLERVTEFMNQCKSTTGGKGFYTSVSGISSKKCVGITHMKNHLKAIELYGTVRDSYNHIAALVYKSEGGGLVGVPVIDDGLSSTALEGTLILDWDDYTPAPADQVLTFYKKHIYPLYALQYSIVKQLKSIGSQKVEAVQLKNGLFVPVVPAAEGVDLGVPPEDISEMEWSINRKIIMSETNPLVIPEDKIQIQTKEMTEVYEHLRLTFSNWLHVQEDGGDLRKVLEETIYRHDIPLFEKRKRLEILLSSTIESWLSESDEDAERSASLLRVDCTLRSKEECSGQCSWASDNKCLIHVPKTDANKASASHILLLRLIEELLRYGARRKQLFDQTVSQLATLDSPIRKGDQYIIPEKSAVWTELLRLEWSYNRVKPLYVEEMSTMYPTNPVAQAASHLPETLKNIFGKDDPLTKNLHLYPSATRNFSAFITNLGVTLSDMKLAEDVSELKDADINFLVRKTMMPLIQIDIRVEPPIIIAKQPQRDLQKGYLVYVLRNEYPVSLLVRDPENPAILNTAEIPLELSNIIKQSTKLFIKMAA
jgi:hypothetical protein